MNPGRFISFEGIDGCGKSTQSRLLHQALCALGKATILTREPGGSPGAEDIRALLVSGVPGRWSAETELLLFTAARRDHLEQTIRPALQKGQIVLCDRFVDSTRVYQGVARADLRQTVDQLHQLIIADEPDLTLIIDTDPTVALRRGLARQSGEDRFESLGLGFQQKLRDGFKTLAQDFPHRCHLINGDQAPETVAQEITRIVLDHLATASSAPS